MLKLINKNSVPTGGDSSPYTCPKCDSPNTTFLEYKSAYAQDYSELGIICDECEYETEPDELGHLLEPEYKENHEINKRK
jgi:hypothetical protein